MTKNNELKIFLLNQCLHESEWSSLLGDKYVSALPFPWSFTEKFEEAQIVAWDGFINPKMAPKLTNIINSLKSGQKILLLQREAYTFFEKNLFATFMNLDQVRYVELQSANVLPEDLILALELCHKKIYHV